MSHTWKFFRAGGFDQVRLDSAAELLAIGELDQKLWVALSCPVKGIEFDARTLQLIDGDADGQVRAPELIAAVKWAGERLKDAAVLAQNLPGVPLALIRDDDEAGAAIAAAARQLAADLAKGEGGLITVDEASAAQTRFAEKALAAWEAAGAEARPLGDATQAALDAMNVVAAKVEDYFVRCRLAAFDERAGPALNAADEAFTSLSGAMLTADAAGVAALPLAKVGPGATVPLGQGVNPAWAGAIATLRDAAVTPLLGAREALTEADWQALKDKLAPYAAWIKAKPDPAAEGDGVRELERLARYVRDLLQLANNFVAFKDFYTRQGKATFQIGTLYLDGRSCELCVAVNDAAKHAALATLARICLVYCDCRRGDEKLSIAAAFTAGDADQLMIGRNGVFYDRQGRDWDATITKIVDHPISLRQAFWSPYKKLARLVAEQLQKLAAAKAGAVEGNMAAVAADVGKKAAAPPPKPPVAPFDVGKFAGIFAAIGLAVGALGTALASMVTGIVALKWWQMPLALVGLMLIVSGPAVIMAWFKLRARNLGPILDANGWAINARARINIPFGTSLTQLAQLPEGSERALSDPYAEKETPWGGYIAIAVVATAAAWWWLHQGT
ncbi:hypothetical protein [Sulfurisoma sediminicola]|uniref:EF-hand domain-containing protein n=1 Tax=Sulfurisoma sediminicola TaxID=1381557 RepID=A0A497XLR8_9PROT|nr:hypothetical protein [Sulfurisoma sediminicola]RLJ68255.1 hypothetical protein DFR35_0809 [Sulfurisoma sediminicola]